MKRHSKIGVMFCHPLKTLFNWVWVTLLYAMFQDSTQIYLFGTGKIGAKITFAITFFIALCITQRHYNKLEMIPPQQRKKNAACLDFCSRRSLRQTERWNANSRIWQMHSGRRSWDPLSRTEVRSKERGRQDVRRMQTPVRDMMH